MLRLTAIRRTKAMGSRFSVTAQFFHLVYELVIRAALPRLTRGSAIMRRVSADDTYRGYYIPRGATVVVNSWYDCRIIRQFWSLISDFRAMLHDERVYSDPGSFRPERFLTDKGELDPDAPDPSPAFGFGRRVCPGMYMAADSVWIACAMILWAFDIEKPVDESGKVMDPIGGYTFGLVW